MNKAVAGDIVSIAGFNNASVTHTLNESGKNSTIPVNQAKTISKLISQFQLILLCCQLISQSTLRL